MSEEEGEGEKKGKSGGGGGKKRNQMLARGVEKRDQIKIIGDRPPSEERCSGDEGGPEKKKGEITN